MRDVVRENDNCVESSCEAVYVHNAPTQSVSVGKYGPMTTRGLSVQNIDKVPHNLDDVDVAFGRYGMFQYNRLEGCLIW